MSAATQRRWQKFHDEVPANFGPLQRMAMAQEVLERSPGGRAARLRAPATGASPFVTTYNQFGQHPAWTGERYMLPLGEELRRAGVPRSSSEPVLKEMEGDHSRGIRGAKPHYVSTYMDIGQVQVPSLARRHEVLNAAILRDAGVPLKVIPPKDIEGDHSQGIKGRAPHFVTTYLDFGGEQPLPKGLGGERIRHPLAEELRDAGVPPLQDAPKDLEGDHTRGIKGATSNYHTTSGDLGRFQKWHKSRYDFGPIAHKNYRQTMWGAPDAGVHASS